MTDLAEPASFEAQLNHGAKPRRTGFASFDLMNVIGYALLIFAAVATIMPFLWMVSTSFKTDQEIFRFPLSFMPDGLEWKNYLDAIRSPEAGRQLVNSLIYALGSTFSNLVFCSLAGYALARMQFSGKNLIFALVVGLLMVPAQSQIVPVYLIVQKIPFAGGNDWLGNGGTGLLNTYWGMILPTAATPFGIFMMRQFFTRIPMEYEESAKLDGAPPFTIFRRILLPLARPSLAVLGVLSFQSAWNDFVWPLILNSHREMATLQIGLQLLQSGPDARWNVVMAMATLITMPIIIVYLFAQRHVVDGAVSSGVKG
ncbi:carbohydrate ABC transporter permease [Rhizobium sp. SSA_523]|uniref:carbohydrate ABC transporter permease n=1 Tax=Rhizobium sp. SSA_523 TaxID=2952477 RepID=UPI002091AF66|nr:carbohydrate ABC transporter permease [Rhizobium sp. SSA_523]MCO5731379.1 carbohydrate ABC transporter permease [Rhizobium sp. SSA_523]WKC22095.1 carbohydrate ABC transporter permease [Rhizobium sp. SSA_523]